MKRLLLSLLLGVLAGCASYDGRGLQPGSDGREAVEALMGAPAMRWREADGSEQWAYPRGPASTQTFMVFLAPDGRLQRIDKVLEGSHFLRIRPELDDRDSVLRLIGPPNPAWTVYFEARDELAWEWLICDDWNKLARFGVLFDARSGKVRSSYLRPEQQGPDGMKPWCGH